MQIILVRHGQTEWNREERFRGRIDLDLTELGLRQAEATGLRVAGHPVKAVYSSPMKRAMQTAMAIASQFKLTVTPLEGLIDQDFGSWQGLSLAEAERSDPAVFRLWVESPHLVVFPGGEGLADVRQRFAGVVEWLRKRHGDDTVVLVSHKVVCKVAELLFLGVDNSYFWQVEQDLCAINIFSVNDGRSFVLRLNDTCHLAHLYDVR